MSLTIEFYDDNGTLVQAVTGLQDGLELSDYRMVELKSQTPVALYGSRTGLWYVGRGWDASNVPAPGFFCIRIIEEVA